MPWADDSDWRPIQPSVCLDGELFSSSGAVSTERPAAASPGTAVSIPACHVQAFLYRRVIVRRAGRYRRHFGAVSGGTLRRCGFNAQTTL